MAPLETVLGGDSPSNATTECDEFYCFSTVRTGQNLVTGMVIDIVLGLLCLLGFIVWRRTFPIYQARLYNSDARFRPSELRVDGHRRLWSWLVPVFKVKDKELLRQGGLDAVASLRILEYGVLLLVPMTILGIAILLPVNYTAQHAEESGDTLTSAFLSMSLSNIPRESKLLWIAFVYLFVFMAWASYLLVRFQSAHVSLANWYQYFSGLTTTNPLLDSGMKIPEQLGEGDKDSADRLPGALATVSPFDKFRKERELAQQSVDLRELHGSPRADVELTATRTAPMVGAPVDDSAEASASKAPPQEGGAGVPSDGQATVPVYNNGDEPPSATINNNNVLESIPLAPRASVAQTSVGPPKTAKEAAAASRGLTRAQAWRAVQDRQAQILAVHGDPCPVPHPGRHAVLVLDDAARRFKFSLDGVLPGVSALEKRRAFWPGAIDSQNNPQSAADGDHESAHWLADSGLAAALVRPTTEEEAAALATGQMVNRSTVPPERYYFDDDAAGNEEDDDERIHLSRGRLRSDDQSYAAAQVVTTATESSQSESKKATSIIAGDSKDEPGKNDADNGLLETQRSRAQWLAPSPSLQTMRRWRRANLRMRAVGRLYGSVFGDDFLGLVPVFDCRGVDKLMARRWSRHCVLERYHQDLDEVVDSLGTEALTVSTSASWYSRHRTQRQRRRKAKLEILIQTTELELEELERDIRDERDRALSRPPCGPFFALFRTQSAASFATVLDVNPADRHLMHTLPSPEPDDINWAALLKGWKQRLVRPLLVLPLILGIMVFPIGIFTGAFSQLSTAVCNSQSGGSSWFCSDDWWAKLLRNIVTGFLPALILSLYQALFLPVVFYLIGQGEGTNYSLNALDARTGSLFFYWNVFNMFLGALLGGSIFSAIRAFIDQPNSIWKLLGSAIPASSNFFVNYVMFRAFTMTFFRLFWPAAAVFPFILKWLRLMKWARTPMDIAAEVPARNLRNSRDVFAIVMAVYIAVTAYAPITPFILPFGLIYFVLTWIVWRYQVLYVFNSSASGHGVVWTYFAHRMVACMLIQTIFFAAMMIVKAAYAQAIIVLVVLPIWLLALNRYLSGLQTDPRTLRLTSWHGKKAWPAEAELFVAPPLRADADEIWFPEWGKAWQYWGVPRYGF